MKQNDINNRLLDEITDYIINKFPNDQDNEKSAISCSKAIIKYLDNNSIFRKLIHFYEHIDENLFLDNTKNFKVCFEISNEKNINLIKSKYDFFTMRNDVYNKLNRFIHEENEYIINRLVEKAKDNDSLKTISKNKEKIEKEIFDHDFDFIITDKNLKYEFQNISGIIEAFFLPEAKNIIIKLNNHFQPFYVSYEFHYFYTTKLGRFEQGFKIIESLLFSDEIDFPIKIEPINEESREILEELEKEPEFEIVKINQ